MFARAVAFPAIKIDILPPPPLPPFSSTAISSVQKCNRLYLPARNATIKIGGTARHMAGRRSRRGSAARSPACSRLQAAAGRSLRCCCTWARLVKGRGSQALRGRGASCPQAGSAAPPAVQAAKAEVRRVAAQGGRQLLRALWRLRAAHGAEGEADAQRQGRAAAVRECAAHLHCTPRKRVSRPRAACRAAHQDEVGEQPHIAGDQGPEDCGRAAEQRECEL